MLDRRALAAASSTGTRRVRVLAVGGILICGPGSQETVSALVDACGYLGMVPALEPLIPQAKSLFHSRCCVGKFWV